MASFMRARAAWILLRVTDSNGCLLGCSSFRIRFESRIPIKTEKPPAALAGGGLGAAVLLLLRQASLPACVLERIIRMKRVGAALHGTGMRLELAPSLSMTLIEVNQRGTGRVKQRAKAGSMAPNPSQGQKVHIVVLTSPPRVYYSESIGAERGLPGYHRAPDA